jgi:hypothetical protein
VLGPRHVARRQEPRRVRRQREPRGSHLAAIGVARSRRGERSSQIDVLRRETDCQQSRSREHATFDDNPANARRALHARVISVNPAMCGQPRRVAARPKPRQFAAPTAAPALESFSIIRFIFLVPK